jgi:hypothetical protein
MKTAIKRRVSPLFIVPPNNGCEQNNERQMEKRRSSCDAFDRTSPANLTGR